MICKHCNLEKPEFRKMPFPTDLVGAFICKECAILFRSQHEKEADDLFIQNRDIGSRKFGYQMVGNTRINIPASIDGSTSDTDMSTQTFAELSEIEEVSD